MPKIALPTRDGFDFIPKDKIVHYRLYGHYVTIHLTSEEKYTVCLDIKKLEDKLREDNF